MPRGRPIREESDDALAARAALGDADALALLLARHFDFVSAVCRRVLFNPSDAEEARQETLVTAARRITTFQQRAQFRTWLYRIAVNTSLDHLDRQRRRPERLLDDQTPELPAPRADPALRLDIDTALRALPPTFREAVVLRDVCDLDYDQIAERLAVPLGTVRSRIARGRDQLAELLGEDARDHAD